MDTGVWESCDRLAIPKGGFLNEVAVEWQSEGWLKSSGCGEAVRRWTGPEIFQTTEHTRERRRVSAFRSERAEQETAESKRWQEPVGPTKG